VWEPAKGSNTITALAAFNTTDGRGPLASVALDANGNLYGTALGSWGSDPGMVWELAKGSSTVWALASFELPSQSVCGGPTCPFAAGFQAPRKPIGLNLTHLERTCRVLSDRAEWRLMGFSLSASSVLRSDERFRDGMRGLAKARGLT
jgi:hypothetical protein